LSGEIPAKGELAAQLQSLMGGRLLDPLEILLEAELAPLRARLREQAGRLAEQLLGDDDRVAQRTAIRLVSCLYPSDGPFDPPARWWQTPLGLAVARRAGHPGAEAVSYAVAGAMLGVTRQGVHDLVTRGKLARHDDGGVTTASVQDRINQRAALGLGARRERGDQ
jgi:hypothetical protein